MPEVALIKATYLLIIFKLTFPKSKSNLGDLNVRKPAGHDGITARRILELPEYAEKTLSYIDNTDYFSMSSKKSCIIMIPKSDKDLTQRVP